MGNEENVGDEGDEEDVGNEGNGRDETCVLQSHGRDSWWRGMSAQGRSFFAHPINRLTDE